MSLKVCPPPLRHRVFLVVDHGTRCHVFDPQENEPVTATRLLTSPWRLQMISSSTSSLSLHRPPRKGLLLVVKRRRGDVDGRYVHMTTTLSLILLLSVRLQERDVVVGRGGVLTVYPHLFHGSSLQISWKYDPLTKCGKIP